MLKAEIIIVSRLLGYASLSLLQLGDHLQSTPLNWDTGESGNRLIETLLLEPNHLHTS